MSCVAANRKAQCESSIHVAPTFISVWLYSVKLGFEVHVHTYYRSVVLLFKPHARRMTATERLNFQLEEPGDDPLSDQVFDILRNTLQPDCEISLEVAAQQIESLLPEGHPYSHEVDCFLTTCYEVAEQIPYYHVSMTRLVTVVDLCLNSSRFKKVSAPGKSRILS